MHSLAALDGWLPFAAFALGIRVPLIDFDR